MEQAAQDYLNARKEARSNTDSKEQPLNTEAVDVLEDSAPIEDVIDTEVNTDEEITPEIEESETFTETKSSETDLFYYDLDGEEVSSDQLKEWKNNGLMQSDYTRKTQAHAEEVKEFNLKQDSFTATQSKLTEQLATLEAMISEDTLDAEAIADMREYDPEKYIEHIERQGKRKDFLKEAKKNANPVSNVNVQEEQAKLVNNNPQWLSNGKATEAYTKDMTELSNYYTANGFTQEQVTAVNSSSILAQAVIDAARYNAINTKKAIVEKRVRKAPVSTKPRAQAQNSVTTEIKKLQERVKRTGDPKLFQELRQLQKQNKG